MFDKEPCEIETTVGGRKMEQSRPALVLGYHAVTTSDEEPCNIEMAIVGCVMGCIWPSLVGCHIGAVLDEESCEIEIYP